MPSSLIQHALGLHLYQPSGSLRDLLQYSESEAGRLLACYERIARHARKYAQAAKLHIALSIPLLEQLRDPDFIEASRHLADVPTILDGFRQAANIEFIGTGYTHAPLPLIPPQDWAEQLQNERMTLESALGRIPKGYCPPASAFTLELIPTLLELNYEYVLLPASALALPDGGAADPFRAYRLSHQGATIPVIPWDSGFSQAQTSGLEAPWFADEVRNGIVQAPDSDAPYLLTTWSDGDNGEWFRSLDEEHGFFGRFFSPYMEFCETGEYPVQPVRISEYLRRHRPTAEAVLKMGEHPTETHAAARNSSTNERLSRVAARYWLLAKGGSAQQTKPPRQALHQARELILRAEESALVLDDSPHRERTHELLERAERLLETKPQPSVSQTEAQTAQTDRPQRGPKTRNPGPGKSRSAKGTNSRKRRSSS